MSTAGTHAHKAFAQLHLIAPEPGLDWPWTAEIGGNDFFFDACHVRWDHTDIAAENGIFLFVDE